MENTILGHSDVNILDRNLNTIKLYQLLVRSV